MQFKHLPYFSLLPEIETYQIAALCEQTQLKEIKQASEHGSPTPADVSFHSICTAPVPTVTRSTKNKAEGKALSKQNQWLFFFFFLQTTFSSLILSPGMIFPFQKAVWRTIPTEPLKARENQQKAAPLCCVLLTLICKLLGYWRGPRNLFAPSLHISCLRIWFLLDSLYTHIDYSWNEGVYISVLPWVFPGWFSPV